MLQVLGIAVATFFCFIILRESSPVFATVVSLTGVVIIALIIIIKLSDFADEINKIISNIPSSMQYVKLMIKVLLITIITQLTSDICRDNGNNALADTIEISAKILIVLMVLPLFEAIITLVLGIIK